MRVQDQAAYILHRRAYRDTSQILELFSRDYGRITVVSKGSRSAKSRSRAILQPFIPLSVSWSGKGEMPTLTASEVMNHTPLKLTGNALPSAFYINELLTKLLHKHDVHDDVFYLYSHVLVLLQNVEELEVTLRLFEKNFLRLLGFEMNLLNDFENDNAVISSEFYQYYIEHGPVLSVDNKTNSSALLIKGESLIDFENETLKTDSSLKEIKSLMRYVLSYYMDGKKIKSRELFR